MSDRIPKGIEKYATNIHEHYNIPRALSSNEKVLKVIKRYKVFKSINALNNEIVELSYGAVWKTVERLQKKDEIIIEKFIDENKRKNTLIFIDSETRDEYMKSLKEILPGKNKIPDYHIKLDDLFKLLLKAPEKENLDTDKAQLYILDKLEELGISINEMDILEKRSKVINNE